MNIMPAGRSGRAWRELSARLRRELPNVCHLCGKAIDLSLHHDDAWSWTLDHIEALINGGEPEDESNLLPAHRKCNSIKGARTKWQRATASQVW